MTFISKILPKKSKPSKPAVLKRQFPFPDDDEFKGRGKIVGVADAELEEIYKYILHDDHYLKMLEDVVMQVKLAEQFPRFNQKMKIHRQEQSISKKKWEEKLVYFDKNSKEKRQMEKDYESFESALELAKTFKTDQNARTIDFFFLYHIAPTFAGRYWWPSRWCWESLMKIVTIDAPECLDISNWSATKILDVQIKMHESLSERGVNPLVGIY